jgi:hypothetical protein
MSSFPQHSPCLVIRGNERGNTLDCCNKTLCPQRFSECDKYIDTDSAYLDNSYDENDRQYFQSDLNSKILELSTGIEDEVIGAMRVKAG